LPARQAAGPINWAPASAVCQCSLLAGRGGRQIGVGRRALLVCGRPIIWQHGGARLPASSPACCTLATHKLHTSYTLATHWLHTGYTLAPLEPHSSGRRIIIWPPDARQRLAQTDWAKFHFAAHHERQARVPHTSHWPVSSVDQPPRQARKLAGSRTGKLVNCRAGRQAGKLGRAGGLRVSFWRASGELLAS